MKIFFKFILIIIFLLAIGIVALNLWLTTDKAKAEITELVSQITKEQAGVDVKIDGISFSLPLIARVSNISISDSEGEFLILKNFYVNVIPSLFSFWEISIWSLAADELKLIRVPNIKTSNSNLAGSETSIFNPNIVLNKVNIKKIILGSGVTSSEEEMLLNFTSHINYQSFKNKLSFNASSSLISHEKLGLGENVFEVVGEYNIDKENLALKSLNFDSDAGKLSGHFFIDNIKNKTGGEIAYNTSILGKILSESFSGTTSNISGEIRFFGTADNPEISTSCNVTIDFPENDYFKFVPLSLLGKTNFNNTSIDSVFEIKQGNIDSVGEVIYKNNKIYLNKLKATAPDFEKKADLVFDTNSSIITGTVSVNAKKLDELSNHIPFLKGGAMELTMNYSSPDNKQQHISAKGKINQLATKFANSGLVTINLSSQDLWNGELGKSSLDFKSLNIGETTLSELLINAYTKNNLMHLFGAIRTKQPYPINLDFASELNLAGEDFIANIRKLSGKVRNIEVANSNDILLQYGKESFLKTEDLKIGAGALNLNAKLIEQDLSASVLLTKIPLRVMPSVLPDSFKASFIDGEAVLSGNLVNPVIKSSIDIGNIIMPNSEDKFNIHILANLSSDKTSASSNISNNTREVAFLSVDLPSKFSLNPFEYSIFEQKAFKAELLIHENFDLLSLVPMPAGSSLEGRMEGKLNARGTLDNPVVRGTIDLSRTEYSYEIYGIKFNDISGQLAANGSDVYFNKVIAKDLMENIISGSGVLSLGVNKDFKFKANTEKFHLLNNPHLQGEVKANISLIGDKDGAKAEGKIALGPMEIKIPERFQPDLEELNVTKNIISHDKDVFQKEILPYDLNLALDVETASQVYVRGWGVDTLLQGNLKIRGTANEPIINGTLKSVRGKYQEFGKSLKVKEGVLTFDGGVSPYLNIVGVTTVDNTEIRLILSGLIEKLDVSIESTPSMSQEAALSLLLFGDSADNISTFQALQLADGVRRLSGKGGGFDPFGAGRKILGVDSINFKNDSNSSDGSSSVGIGKHLTDKVYLEVEQGLQGDNTKTIIEVEITPKISIENILEQEGNSFFGINWKYDY